MLFGIMERQGLDAASCFAEGNRLLQAGDLAGAEACFAETARRLPDSAAALGNLGLVLDRRGRHEEAERCFLQSIALDPAHPQLHLNHGALLFRRKRFAAAELAYRTAIGLAPEAPAGWSNLGVLLACLKREEEAEFCYRKAMSIEPEHANASFNLSYLLLRQGRYDEGWRCLDARNWYAALEQRLACPRWQGEPLGGRSLLVGWEAGLGDMIQMVRYLPLLKARGAGRLGLLCHPALLPLFAGMAAVDEVFAVDAALPAAGWDCWVPPFSLPLHFATRIETIPAALPYLHPDPARVARWRAAIPAGGLRVGLAWKGNPRFENDADRSLPGLAALAPLAAVPGVRFFSLQQGAGADEAANPPPGLQLTDLGGAIGDFADTAAIVACLDLVICVDTAVAHLAGALGKPCWVLLPDYMTDWRWLKERTDSPWYPRAMRLFRQSRMGDWESVVAAVATALGALSA